MGFMRRLLLSRSDADGTTAAETMGLDAFGTETAAGAPVADAAPPRFEQQSRIAIGVLAALVLLEAVPTGLWIRQRLRSPAVPTVAAASLPPAATIPLASCEPAPATPAPPATAAATAAATTGLAKGAGAAPVRSDAAVPPVAPIDKSMLAG